jgi:SMC interacting uncharacterized protein involved in chromosome segregation
MKEPGKQETYQELVDYKKRARYVMMKLHKEVEAKEEEIKILEQVNGILRAKLKKASEK